MTPFRQEIADALGAELPQGAVRSVNVTAALPSWFDTSGLAAEAMRAAAAELAALFGGEAVLDHRLVGMWYQMSLRPQGWEMPSLWDAVAGDYQARDGWIRLHTNAPHHRDAALGVLGCAVDRDAVARKVAAWDRSDLEARVVEAGGAAAAMRSVSEWQAHPQGQAVSTEPLISWSKGGEVARGGSGLDGLRVLDLTRVLAGPVATRLLAGYGAQVLRIDPPQWSEPGVEPEVTLGKRCAGLDLKTQAGRAQFEALLREADILVHGYRPGALAGLGYDTAALDQLARGQIRVALCAYGWSGPWAGRRGFDSLVQMSCGIAAEGMARSGAARPVPLPVQALDHATGYLMAAAVLRAVRLREAGGLAMHARLSLARTAALLMSQAPMWHAPVGAEETPEDQDPRIEETQWGPARRIRWPVTLASRPVCWPHPGGSVRRHRVAW